MADAYLSNAQWVHRVEELFAQADLNKNGFLELADWELWVNNTEKACNPSPAVSYIVHVPPLFSESGCYKG